VLELAVTTGVNVFFNLNGSSISEYPIV
jgi:hypothetical protein